jgi:hypothetical protein
MCIQNTTVILSVSHFSCLYSIECKGNNPENIVDKKA